MYKKDVLDDYSVIFKCIHLFEVWVNNELPPTETAQLDIFHLKDLKFINISVENMKITVNMLCSSFRWKDFQPLENFPIETHGSRKLKTVNTKITMVSIHPNSIEFLAKA